MKITMSEPTRSSPVLTPANEAPVLRYRPPAGQCYFEWRKDDGGHFLFYVHDGCTIPDAASGRDDVKYTAIEA